MTARTILVPLLDGTIAEIEGISSKYLELIRRDLGYDSVDDVTDREIVQHIIKITKQALDKRIEETDHA